MIDKLCEYTGCKKEAEGMVANDMLGGEPRYYCEEHCYQVASSFVQPQHCPNCGCNFDARGSN